MKWTSGGGAEHVPRTEFLRENTLRYVLENYFPLAGRKTPPTIWVLLEYEPYSTPQPQSPQGDGMHIDDYNVSSDPSVGEIIRRHSMRAQNAEVLHASGATFPGALTTVDTDSILDIVNAELLEVHRRPITPPPILQVRLSLSILY